MSLAPRERIPVAVLGATGAVGQAFVRLLADHPWFRLAEVAASERSAGKSYAEAARWSGDGLDQDAARLSVLPCISTEVRAPIIFSALDSNVAGTVEEEFAADGRFVLTNARNHRMDPDVPILVAEVNATHLPVLKFQQRQRGWSGGIIANGNCASIVVAMALAPLQAAFGVRNVFLATLQALSGAGYPGVPSLDIVGNIIPFIGGGEEEKIEREVPKMLGTLVEGRMIPAPMTVSAQVHRVPVEHGHTASMAIALEGSATPEEVRRAIKDWAPLPGITKLPSAPPEALVILEGEDRPQPRRDADRGRGMTITIGRIRSDPIFDVRLVACGHNIVRGAAGASILNAELLAAEGWIPAASQVAK
jgi:aspartate-semialdehyde dehydrogenase